MKQFSKILLLALLALFALSGCDSIKRFMWESPGRDDWQNPEQVVAALGLKAGDRVADLGSGGGYFTFPMAEEVGPSGRVYAVDIEQSLLAYIAEQAEERGLPQIETIRSEGRAGTSGRLVGSDLSIQRLSSPTGSNGIFSSGPTDLAKWGADRSRGFFRQRFLRT